MPTYHDAAAQPSSQPKTACARFYDWCLGIDAPFEREPAMTADIGATQHRIHDAVREARVLARVPLAEDQARMPVAATVLDLETYRRKRSFSVPVLHPVRAQIIEMPRDRTTVRKGRRNVG